MVMGGGPATFVIDACYLDMRTKKNSPSPTAPSYDMASDKVADGRRMATRGRAQSVALHRGDPELEATINGILEASIGRKKEEGDVF